MDEVPEEDLQQMDLSLAKVFATKKKVKEGETTELRGLMRTLKLIELMLNRQPKSCNVSIPLLLLMPIIHSLQLSIKGKKAKNKHLPTRIVTVLNKLNSIKKIEGIDSVEQGTLFTMARDLVSLSKQGKNRIIMDLLGDSVVMLTKCYLQGPRNKGEDTGFATLYTGLLDLKDDKRNKNKGIANNKTSLALVQLPNRLRHRFCKRHARDLEQFKKLGIL